MIINLKKIIALVILLLMVVGTFTGCTQNKSADDDFQGTPGSASAEPGDPTKGILLDKETNEASEYSLEVLRMGEIDNEFLIKWMETSMAGEIDDSDGPVYYALYNNSSPSLDIYLFMPEAKAIMGDVTLLSTRITESGSALLIYIDTDEETQRSKESTDLILHIKAVSGSTKTKNERLIINGETYTCANTTFTALK